MAGNPERITLWLQACTGLELDRASDTIRGLDAAEWAERRRRLADLGGPP